MSEEKKVNILGNLKFQVKVCANVLWLVRKKPACSEYTYTHTHMQAHTNTKKERKMKHVFYNLSMAKTNFV